MNKGSATEWIDPFSGFTQPLFNPRKQLWEEHFHLRGGEIVGTSPVGRATAALLFRSTPHYAPLDLGWEKLNGLEECEPLYYFLNHLRYQRLRNDFSSLFSKLTGPWPELGVAPRQLSVASFARNLLLLELYFTRSRPKDVETGLALGKKLFSSQKDVKKKRELAGMLSILHQQRATLR